MLDLTFTADLEAQAYTKKDHGADTLRVYESSWRGCVTVYSPDRRVGMRLTRAQVCDLYRALGEYLGATRPPAPAVEPPHFRAARDSRP